MTWTGRQFLAAMGLAGAVALGGCAYDDGYYGGVNVGAGYYGGGYYDDYWGPGYYRPGLYGGWYDDFYYPGSGYYVYDRGGRRHRWSEGQRRYWEGRREARRAEGGRNWSGDRQWQGNRQWQGDRQWQGSRQGQTDGGHWRGSWREFRDRSATNPPVTQSQPGTSSPRGDWGARSAPDTRSDGARQRGDGRRSWRR